MTMHSSVLVWRIPWAEEPGGLESMGHKELDMTECLSTHREILGREGKLFSLLPP